VPETVTPLAGDTITTFAEGVGDGVGVANVAVAVGVADVTVGVGVGELLAIVTVIDAVATTPLEFLPSTLMVWAPFEMILEFQLKVLGGEDAR
jgi:Na+-transporting NADH:ubiquinone oxidoreductase subunit NqrD